MRSWTIRQQMLTVLSLVLVLSSLGCAARRGAGAGTGAGVVPPPPEASGPPVESVELPRLARSAPAIAAEFWAWSAQAEDAAQELVATADRDAGAAAAMEELAAMEFAASESSRLAAPELAGVAFDLPLVVNQPVLSVVNYFQTRRGRRILEAGLRRGGRYAEMIGRILAEEDVPQDLIFVAQAESGFRPTARSRRRAAGLWQFMAARARQYGLQVGWWVDERRDPEKATRAAAQHLRELYQRFGDWYLALAAYNAGPLRVQRAIRRTGQTDYWELRRRRALPRETRNFVPIILAMALMAKNSERYGLRVEPEPPLRVETVGVARPTDLRLIAKEIGVSVRRLRRLNPHLLHNVTPLQPDFRLYVPAGTGEVVRAALPRLPEDQRVLWSRHRVRRGDTLSGIAARYGSSAVAIAAVNAISLRKFIHPGQVLLVPPTRSVRVARRLTGRAPGRTERAANEKTIHRVRRGETLWGLARRYQTTVGALRRANRFLAHRTLRADDRLVIPD
ncbi:MAG: transglycosylase SLT domain-containing protein [Terriglobia bacterium]